MNEEKLYYYLSVNFVASQKELLKYLKVSKRTLANYLKNIATNKLKFKNKIIVHGNLYFIKNGKTPNFKLDVNEYILQKILLEGKNLSQKEIQKLFFISESTFRRRIKTIETKVDELIGLQGFLINDQKGKWNNYLDKWQRFTLAFSLLRRYTLINHRNKLNYIIFLILKEYPTINKIYLEEVALNIYFILKIYGGNYTNHLPSTFLTALTKNLNIDISLSTAKMINKLIASYIDQKFLLRLEKQIKEQLELADKKFKIKISKQKQMIKNLAHHLLIYINLKGDRRFKYKITNTLKAKYPFEYLIAIQLANYISKAYDIRFSDDELALLATHVLNGFQNKKQKINVFIITYNKSIHDLIKRQLNKAFNYFNFVTKINQASLIISTSEIHSYKLKSQIVVNPLLEEDDYKKIDFFINQVHHKSWVKKIALLDNHTKEMHDTLTEIFKNLHFNNQKYLSEIMLREKISATNIGNGIAMPHILIDSYHNSGIYIFKLKKSISWNEGDNVLMIILTLVTRDNIAQITEAFQTMSKAIGNLKEVDLLQINSIKKLKLLLKYDFD